MNSIDTIIAGLSVVLASSCMSPRPVKHIRVSPVCYEMFGPELADELAFSIRYWTDRYRPIELTDSDTAMAVNCYAGVWPYAYRRAMRIGGLIPERTLGMASPEWGVELLYNGSGKWENESCDPMYDHRIRRVLTHEFGHYVGLEHNLNPASIMNPQAATCHHLGR